MKPAPFDYYAPRTIEEAYKLLAEAGGGATVLAGGQTLMPLLALRMSQPFILVDINKIDALKGVTRVTNATRIGPVVRQNEVIADETLRRCLPVLVTATRHVGHHQTRNRGTIGERHRLRQRSRKVAPHGTCRYHPANKKNRRIQAA